MRTEVEFVNVQAHLANGIAPVRMLPRHQPGQRSDAQFWVPQAPITEGSELPWSLTKTGESVRIPLFAYRVARAHGALTPLGVQLGVAALADLLRGHVRQCPEVLYLVASESCDELGDAFRVHLGFAFRL